jgi:hypothetical protein
VHVGPPPPLEPLLAAAPSPAPLLAPLDALDPPVETPASIASVVQLSIVVHLQRCVGMSQIPNPKMPSQAQSGSASDCPCGVCATLR